MLAHYLADGPKWNMAIDNVICYTCQLLWKVKMLHAHTQHHTAIHSGLFDWLPWITDVAWLFFLLRNRWLNFWEEIFQQLHVVRPRCLCSLITNHTLKKTPGTFSLTHHMSVTWILQSSNVMGWCVWHIMGVLFELVCCASLWLYRYWYHLYFKCFIQVYV